MGSAGADLSRPEFIKAAGELGLDVRQAMQRLGVRSLEGLNLRESLELLRRQAVRGDEPAPATESGPAPAAPTSAGRPAPVRLAAPARPSGAPPAAPQSAPAYGFDEEEEPELTFTIDGDEELDEAFGGYSTGSGTPAGGADSEDYDTLEELDELDLDDVPDFGPPAPAHTPAARRKSAPAGSTAAPPAPEPERPGAPASAAGELIARLRGAHAGGVMSGQQRTAYRNIVVNELGEARAAGLVRGLWNVTPERLGAEQADELLSWGKRDTFADEATQVLAELRAERERERGAGDGSPTGGAASRQGARGRPAARRASDTAGGF